MRFNFETFAGSLCVTAVVQNGNILSNVKDKENASNLPEVFWLKLMALDAHDDGLMSVNGFPINLTRGKKKTNTFKFFFLLICLLMAPFLLLQFQFIVEHVKRLNETVVCG